MKSTYLINYFIVILLISSIKYTSEEEDEHLDIKYLVNSQSQGWVLNQLGLTEEKIPKLTEKGKKLAIKFIKARVKRGIDEMLKMPKEEVECNFENQLIHSKVSAVKNMLRDKKNRGYAREVVYMYLSHYVDIPAIYLEGSCSKHDNSPYYANWITDDDRDVYESFLRVNNGLKGLDELMNLLDLAKGIKGDFEDYQKEAINSGFFGFVKYEAEKNFQDYLVDYGSELIDGKTPSEYFQGKIEEFAEHFNFIDEDGTAEEIISVIRGQLSKDFANIDTLETACDAVSAAFDVAINNANPFTAALTMVKLPMLLITTLGPKAAVAGMLYSLSGRIAGRLMRAIEEGYV